MLMVVATIGTLGAVVLPKLLDMRQEAKEAHVAAIVESISSAIKLQTHNTIIKCGKAFGDFPTIESLRANDIVAGDDCAANSLTDFDRHFVTTDLQYPPVNSLNGLSTIGLASNDPDQATFDSGKCSSDPNSEDFGWCYNPESGTFWASTDRTLATTALTDCGGDVDPGYCGTPSSSSSSVSSSVSSTACGGDVDPGFCGGSSSSSSISSSSSVSSSSSSEPPVSSSSSSISSSSSVSSSSSSEPPASSSSSSSSVVSSSSSSSSSGGGSTGGGSTGGGTDPGSSSSSESSSSSSSSVSSSSSSSSSISSSSSSSTSALFATCDEVPEDQRITVISIINGENELPPEAIYIRGSTQKVCTCKSNGNGFTQQSPSLTGVFNGVGHQNSFFVLGSSCE